MNRYTTYGVAVVVALAATYAFQPGLRHFFWPAIAWTIFIMSAMVALAVVGNILVVLYHMLIGYIPEEERRLKESSSDMQTKVPFEPRSPADKPGKAA